MFKTQLLRTQITHPATHTHLASNKLSEMIIVPCVVVVMVVAHALTLHALKLKKKKQGRKLPAVIQII